MIECGDSVREVGRDVLLKVVGYSSAANQPQAQHGNGVAKIPSELSGYPLSRYFLSGYLSRKEDPVNFPPGDLAEVFQRYENLFGDSLKALGLSKESLRARSEFNFGSGDAANLEGGIAILRVVCALEREGFVKIALVRPGRGGGADITCEMEGHKFCCEVKAITKQSRPGMGVYLADQLYSKMLESVSKAGLQLGASARELGCSVRIFVCVVNWFLHSIHLGQNDYKHIVRRLEREGDQQSLVGIDGVFIVTRMGDTFLFPANTETASVA
jgi:hypothetical protein